MNLKLVSAFLLSTSFLLSIVTPLSGQTGETLNAEADTLRNSPEPQPDSNSLPVDNSFQSDNIIQEMKTEIVSEIPPPQESPVQPALLAEPPKQVEAEFTKKNPLKISAWGWITAGQVDSSYYDRVRHSSYNYNDAEIMNVEMGLRIIRDITRFTFFDVHINGYMTYPVLKATDRRADSPLNSQKKSFKMRLLGASITSSMYQSEQTNFGFKFGYWSHKYNPQARNLGEYLFRSVTYPGVLVSGFEIADKAKVAGLNLRLSHTGGFHHDVFFTTETEIYPLYDLSLAYVLRFRPVSLIDFGVGASLGRIISANKNYTTPANDTMVFSSAVDSFYTSYTDPETGKTTNFTFAGTKLMGRLTLDPKWFFTHDILGKEDLKLYTEAAFLGVKDYPLWYDKKYRRMPVMFGFNIPAFKLLEVLAFEMEYYASRYSNSTLNIWNNRSPIPYTGTSVPTRPEDDTYVNYKRDNWKWSLYASKKIAGFLRLSGQIANDHSSRQGNLEDITQTPKEWYWVSRLMFYF